jgi:hypothetical protein
MKRTLRRIDAPRKKWSRNEKWFGARITGPLGGTRSGATPRVRNATQEYSEVAMRTISYIASGSRVRARAWKRAKYSGGRGSL